MHVVFFNRSYYPDTTATAQLLGELCESLVSDYGHKISVVTGAPSEPTEKTSQSFAWKVIRREKHQGVDILRVKSTSHPKGHPVGRFSNYLSYFFSACWAGLRLDRPDVVVALTDPPIIGLAARLASLRFRSRFVMSYQDIFPEVGLLLEDFRSKAVNRVLQSVNCYLSRSSDRCVTLGESMSRRLVTTKGAAPGNIVVISSWADCEQIRPAPKENPFSITNGLVDRFVVMHSGNIGLSQGLDVLVEAAEHLSRYPEIQVTFVGDGVKKTDLERKARSTGLRNVCFLPYAPKERLTESFASADVFIISLKPGLSGFIVPSKVYGILAAGRPFVASVEEDTEIARIAKQFECGLLSRPADSADLAEKILQLHRDTPMRRQFGINARKAALHFDRRSRVRAYHDLFQNLTQRN